MNGWPIEYLKALAASRRHLRDHADRGDHALVGIMDVGGVVIEGRHRPDAAAHHRHRMRVAAEAGEEPRHLLVHHRVPGDAVFEVLLLLRRRQLAVEKQVGDLQEGLLLRQLVDRIAAIEKDALVAVDEGDGGGAGGGGGETRVVGEAAGLLVERADVDDLRPGRAVEHVEVPALVADRECGRLVTHVHLRCVPGP